ncbi:hypothetical protein M2432_004814 [Mycobacterium sp. OTB74]|jgi:hypothetical protein|nr:hypothetical protein [Mycobacterium sp. OTB74]
MKRSEFAVEDPQANCLRRHLPHDLDIVGMSETNQRHQPLSVRADLTPGVSVDRHQR